MAQIYKKTLENLKQAHFFFKEYPEANAYIKYREGDQKYIEAVVEKWSWYYGKDNYVYFDSSVYAFTVSPALIDEMIHDDNILKEYYESLKAKKTK